MMTLKERKSSTEPSEQQMKLILSGTAQNDGDYIELYWQGTSTSLELGYVPAGANSPVNSPSVIANIIPIGAQGRDSNLNELNDVDITSPTDGQLLRYDNTDQRWENWTPTSLGSVFIIDYDYNIVGVRDGTNTNFSTTSNFKTNSTRVYLNGVRLTRGVGYDYVELSSNQISIDAYAPLASDRLIIEYEQL
jgi:hypothetical protein